MGDERRKAKACISVLRSFEWGTKDEGRKFAPLSFAPSSFVLRLPSLDGGMNPSFSLHQTACYLHEDVFQVALLLGEACDNDASAYQPGQ